MKKIILVLSVGLLISQVSVGMRSRPLPALPAGVFEEPLPVNPETGLIQVDYRQMYPQMYQKKEHIQSVRRLPALPHRFKGTVDSRFVDPRTGMFSAKYPISEGGISTPSAYGTIATTKQGSLSSRGIPSSVSRRSSVSSTGEQPMFYWVNPLAGQE